LEAQQRAEEEQKRLEAQRRAEEEQKRLEAQRRAEEEQKRLEAQRRAEEEQKRRQDQFARLEPDSNKPQARPAVSIPAAILKGFGSTATSTAPENWAKKVSAFRMDLQPVSNREFLDFVTTHPQWRKSQVSSSVHDGDYLKHWSGDTTVQSEDMDRPVRYISFFAADAYCNTREKRLPTLNHYRIAAKDTPRDSLLSIEYDTPYQAPNFNFTQMEWTRTAWSEAPDRGKRVTYKYGTVQSPDSNSQNYEENKRYTGRSLGFRCAEY
jgi:formylglycine-generating enzyme required for sulfatase activity